jgi:Protein of unknown function (DUF4232)
MRRSALLVSVVALVPAACGGATATSTKSMSKQAARTAPPSAAAAPANRTTTTSTTTSGKTTTTTTAGATTTTTPTTAQGSSTPATTTPVAGPVACTAANLALSYLGQQGATGHGEIGIALHNITGSSCHTFGYPGVQFLDRAGQPLPTDSTRTTQDFFGDAPEEALVVGSGQSVSFRLGVTHGAVSPQNCTTAYGLQVIAPDDTTTMRMPIPGGAYECRTATVSPLRPGDSAYP